MTRSMGRRRAANSSISNLKISCHNKRLIFYLHKMP